MGRTWNPFIPVALIWIVACGREGAPLGPDDAEDEPAALARGELHVSLVSPAEGTSIPQNDPSIGCPADPHRGYGFKLVLAWDDTTDASRIEHYTLWVQHRGSQYPMIDTSTRESEYSFIACNGFVIDRNLDHWEWKVRAVSGNGRVGPWSEGEFSFEPCRLEGGTPCNAPAQP